MPKAIGTSVSRGALGLEMERETRAVLNTRFSFAAGGCPAVPCCCPMLPEVFVEMPSSTPPSPFYSLYIPFQPSDSDLSFLEGLHTAIMMLLLLRV